MIKLADNWKDYECIDAGNGEKLERWGKIVLRRPDPQAVWNTNHKGWEKADAIYHRSKSGGGSWEMKKTLPEHWTIGYRGLTFKVSPTGFKHTGLFPEQAANWDWMMDMIEKNKDKEIRILNLFAYTGGATMACSKAGAKEVVHVDASKGMVQWAKENMQLSHLEGNTIRFIVDDVLKFVKREQKRGHTYHGILMDPPSYGRGPNGEMWKLENQLNELIEETLKILDDDALFFLVNAYTTGFSNTVLSNILKTTVLTKFPNGTIETGEVGLPISKDDLVLPCGIYGKWTRNEDNL
ncbi:MAG: class I SAM-dependent methyltransferase [Erysipelotrichaceae bacterium]|nr:class I SAM-dependent methyltransferase [Erysipelotrichaceae bacterium]